MTDKFRVNEMAILMPGDPAWPEYDNAPVIVIHSQSWQTGWCSRIGLWRGFVYCVRCHDGTELFVREAGLRKLNDGGETRSTERELELVT